MFDALADPVRRSLLEELRTDRPVVPGRARRRPADHPPGRHQAPRRPGRRRPDQGHAARARTDPRGRPRAVAAAGRLPGALRRRLGRPPRPPDPTPGGEPMTEHASTHPGTYPRHPARRDRAIAGSRPTRSSESGWRSATPAELVRLVPQRVRDARRTSRWQAESSCGSSTARSSAPRCTCTRSSRRRRLVWSWGHEAKQHRRARGRRWSSKLTERATRAPRR